MRINEILTETQIDEIDRRGFLKGIGAAALAGAAGKVGAQVVPPRLDTDYAPWAKQSTKKDDALDDEKKAKAIRDANLEKMRARQSNKDDSTLPYPTRIMNRVSPNIVFKGDYSTLGDVRTGIMVKVSNDGTITSIEMYRSSGNDEWDKAALKAVEKSSPLPIPSDGSPPPPVMKFAIGPSMATKPKESVQQDVPEK